MRFELAAQTPLAQNHQSRRALRTHAGKGIEQHIEALDLTEPAHTEDDRRLVRRKPRMIERRPGLRQELRRHHGVADQVHAAGGQTGSGRHIGHHLGRIADHRVGALIHPTHPRPGTPAAEGAQLGKACAVTGARPHDDAQRHAGQPAGELHRQAGAVLAAQHDIGPFAAQVLP